jgi:hypothetical protein
MAAHKFNTAQREAHLLTVADMYLTGQPQTAIAEKVGVSRQMIGAYLKTLQARWQAAALEAIDTRKARELARLDRLEREYWLAWERSQKDAETIKQKQTGKGDAAKVQAEKQSKGQAGDPRYLQGIMQCIEMRLKIVGGFAPTKVDLTWKEALEQNGLDASSAFEQLVQAAYARAAATDGGGSGTGSSATHPTGTETN